MTPIPEGATYADAIDRCCSHRSPLRRDGECRECLDESEDVDERFRGNDTKAPREE
jgi:hypothetical protein